MHFNIINRQGYVIGLAVVLGTYSYYVLHKSIYNCAQEIDTDELYKKYKLEPV